MDIIKKEDRATITDMPKVRKVPYHAVRNEMGGNVASTVDCGVSEPVVEKKKTETKKLKKRLLEVAEKNESLAKTILDRNKEITELKRSVQSLNEVLNSVPIDELRCNSSIAGNKILELSKKNRMLRAELETMKNKMNKKDIEVQKLERDLKAVQNKERVEPDAARKGTTASGDELQSKFSNLQQKLFETRNKNLELQAQLKMAHKCLQQEVGEPFNLINILSPAAQSSWRGRAQQILTLQQRVNELRERLELYEGRNSGRLLGGFANHEATDAMLGPTVRSGNSCTKNLTADGSLSNYSGNNIVDRFTPGVRKSELLHRAKVEGLEADIANLNMQLEDHKSKILALKVRNKTLNDEILKYKAKASSLVEQTDFNEVNMATMNEKLNEQKLQYQQRIDEMSREMASAVRKCEEAEYKVEEMRNKLENQEEVIGSKDEFIEELHDAISRLETDLKAVCGGFLFSCRELRKEEFIALLDSLEAEKNMIMDHNKTLNDRLKTERDKNESLNDQMCKQKIRICRLETKIRDLEKELEVQVERKKRSQRIADYANSISSTSLHSFVFENSSSFSKIQNNENIEAMKTQLEDLKNQLEFSTEKITLLEERIANIKMEKEQDSKKFTEIMNNTKEIILNTITANRNGSYGSPRKESVASTHDNNSLDGNCVTITLKKE